MSTIEIDGAERLLARFEQLKPAVRAGIQAGLLHVKGKIAIYPTRSRRKQPFVSDKQRRGFFYHLHAGDIDVPYRRGQSPNSKKLGQSWTTKMDSDTSGRVGTSVSYAQLVQDRELQTAYHKGTGWGTVQDVQEKEGQFVREAVAQALRKGLGLS